jgi:hypothetical protein
VSKQASLAIAALALLLLEVCRCRQLPLLGRVVHDYMSAFVDERDASAAAFTTHLALLGGLAVPVWLAAAAFPPGHYSSGPGTGAVAGAADGMGAAGLAPSSTSRSPTQAQPSVDFPQTQLSSLTPCPAAISCEVVGGGGKDSAARLWWLLAATSGMVSIGVGDAAASIAGRALGRRRLHAATSKTWEGTAAGAAAMLACHGWILSVWAVAGAAAAAGWWGGVQPVPLIWVPRSSSAWGAVPFAGSHHHELPVGGSGGGGTAAGGSVTAAAAVLGCVVRQLVWLVLPAAATAALEAVTLQLDNLVVPLWHLTWTLMALGFGFRCGPF